MLLSALWQRCKPMAKPEPDSGSICILPRLKGLGGPASFAARLTAALHTRGWQVVADPLTAGVRALLIIGGTRRLDVIWRARQRGVHIVQRLNGMNWVQRKLPTGPRHFIKAEIANWILAITRRHLAHHIIYQSRFTQDWWQTVYGVVRAPGRVIYNGVDLQTFTPGGPQRPPEDRWRLLMVEAHLGGGMEPGLENAVHLLQQLNLASGGRRWELQVVGDVPEEVRARWAARAGQGVVFSGAVARDQVPALDRSAHLLFSADLNAACPNSVVEALACGLPVVAFATGALPEMVTGDAGRVVPYGSSHWNLEPPNLTPLVAAAQEIAAHQPIFRTAARARAVETFDIDRIVASYLEVLLRDH
jgi:glycosyltransferase involved in cell wall biosynthesis